MSKEFVRITGLWQYIVLFLLPSLVGHVTADFPIHLPIEKRVILMFGSSGILPYIFLHLMVSHVTSEGSERLHVKTFGAQTRASNALLTEKEI